MLERDCQSAHVIDLILSLRELEAQLGEVAKFVKDPLFGRAARKVAHAAEDELDDALDARDALRCEVNLDREARRVGGHLLLVDTRAQREGEALLFERPQHRAVCLVAEHVRHEELRLRAVVGEERRHKPAELEATPLP